METRMLPPSGRDFEAYRLVRFEQKSTREAAAELGISQTLVRRLVDRVGDFLAEVTPAADKNDEGRRRRLNVGEQVAAERVDYLCGEAVQKWRDSKGVQTTVRQSGNEPPVTVVKETQGEPRYLLAAARLAIAGGKLPVSTLGSQVRYEEDENEVAANPAAEVCSVEVAPSGDTATSTPAEEVAKLAAVEVCEAPVESAVLPKIDEAECAQLPVANAIQRGKETRPTQERPVQQTRRERKLERRKQKLERKQTARQAFLGQSATG